MVDKSYHNRENLSKVNFTTIVMNAISRRRMMANKERTLSSIRYCRATIMYGRDKDLK